MPTISELAGEAYDWFETVTRSDGEPFIRTKDGCPDWITETIREAHADMLPDDWRYDKIQDAFGHIHDSGVEDEYDLERADLSFEFADQGTDIYNSDRTAWLNSSLHRAGYCDEAQEEGLVGEDTDFFQRLGAGQYMELREIFDAVARGCVERLNELDEEE